MGQISNISARLGMARENFKKIIDSKECDFIEDWHSFNKEEKESLLASFSALNI